MLTYKVSTSHVRFDDPCSGDLPFRAVYGFVLSGGGVGGGGGGLVGFTNIDA